MSETVTTSGAPEESRSGAAHALPRVIAVDGSAASGKSSIGRRLAARLGYPFLDTGVMYRAVTFAALDSSTDISDEAALGRLAQTAKISVSLAGSGSGSETVVSVDGRDVTSSLRRSDVEEAVSLVSRVPVVRDALVRQQREIAERKAIVMAGRDIGTVVLPRAELKLYLDASVEERAGRRHREFESLGRELTHDEVLGDLRRRDRIDTERDVSPLRPADDAVIINTDELSLDEVMARVIAIVEGKS
jgi:cytidylate kinase